MGKVHLAVAGAQLVDVGHRAELVSFKASFGVQALSLEELNKMKPPLI